MVPCQGEDCTTNLSSPGLCSTCEAKLEAEFRSGWEIFEKMLHLEAQFVEWCKQNHRPDPHS